MKAHEAIKATYDFSRMVMDSYVGDLSDEELMQRPAEGCNHVAWQLGHLISSECNLLNMVKEGAAPELPDGFATNHDKENAGSDDASQFLKGAQYAELFEQVKAATFAAIDSFSDDDLDQPGPEMMRQMCPTLGSFLTLVATHVMMHAGQIVPLRRRLEKPIVI